MSEKTDRTLPQLVWWPTEYYASPFGEKLPGLGFASEIGGIFRFLISETAANSGMFRLSCQIAGIWKQISCHNYLDLDIAKSDADKQYLIMCGVNPLDKGKMQS